MKLKHDAFARQYLSDIKVAQEFLEQYLSQEIKIKCDLNSISIQSNSFIESYLKSHVSEL